MDLYTWTTLNIKQNLLKTKQNIQKTFGDHHPLPPAEGLTPKTTQKPNNSCPLTKLSSPIYAQHC